MREKNVSVKLYFKRRSLSYFENELNDSSNVFEIANKGIIQRSYPYLD